MLTNNQKERILTLSSATDKRKLRKDLFFIKKERRRKEKRTGKKENLKGNRKMLERGKIEGIEGWRPGLHPMLFLWLNGVLQSVLHCNYFLVNVHKIATTHLKLSKEDADIVIMHLSVL